MELNYISGVIEFFSLNDAPEVRRIIGDFSGNFLNVTYHENFEKNRGSLLVPFAKAFKADMDDELFLDEKLKELLVSFYPIELFSIVAYMDLEKIGSFKVLIYSLNKKITWKKYRLDMTETFSTDMEKE